MDPFEIFQSSGIYKVAILYFSHSRGLAIIGRHTADQNVEVIQISGEVDPHSGNFTALDYVSADVNTRFPVVTKTDFELLVSFIEGKIDDQTRMSIIEPEVIRNILTSMTLQSPSEYIH